MNKEQCLALDPPRLDAISHEVLYSREPILAVTRKHIAFLRCLAAESSLGRARICAHRTPGDPVHEMLIAVEKRSYIRPHKHLSKSESFHMIEGAMDILIFSDNGALGKVIPMSAYADSGCFYYRLCEPHFHTMLLRSDWVLFHETTTGPFEPHESVGAPWAPDEQGAQNEIENFQSQLVEAARAHTGRATS